LGRKIGPPIGERSRGGGFSENIITTEKLGVRNVKGFVLSDNETIIDKRKNGNRNSEVF